MKEPFHNTKDQTAAMFCHKNKWPIGSILQYAPENEKPYQIKIVGFVELGINCGRMMGVDYIDDSEYPSDYAMTDGDWSLLQDPKLRNTSCFAKPTTAKEFCQYWNIQPGDTVQYRYYNEKTRYWLVGFNRKGHAVFESRQGSIWYRDMSSGSWKKIS